MCFILLQRTVIPKRYPNDWFPNDKIKVIVFGEKGNDFITKTTIGGKIHVSQENRVFRNLSAPTNGILE